MKFKPTSKAGGLVVELGPKEAALPPPVAAPAAVLPEFKLKQILVPVDFSECSRKALQYALPLARQFNAGLILLHVLQPYVPIAEMPSQEMESLEDARRDLEEVQAEAGTTVVSRVEVRRGAPHTQIIDAAKELDVDLIVISTHGRKGLTRVLLGSTAEKVIRHAGCPVLVVREVEHEFVAADA